MNRTFVSEQSIVRKIWGNSDAVLFIFAGAAAEFALNKAVDWLYFTGKLPADPLGRLFSTVGYAHRIIFASEEDALKAIDTITAIHAGVEQSRNAKIPDWAYRDVLYMLIEYTISAWELLEHKLTAAEKEEVYDVFYRMGSRMELKELPTTYSNWLPDRSAHLINDLAYGQYTPNLFAQYKKHLGWLRYNIMLQVQAMLVPFHVRTLLNLKSYTIFSSVLKIYKAMRLFSLSGLVRSVILPTTYRQQILALNR